MTQSAASVSTLKVASINVNGLRAQAQNGIPKRRKIFTWIKQLNFDVILLQETHSSVVDCDKWINEWGGLGYFSHGDNMSRGVGILLKPNSGLGIDHTFADKDGRFLTLELDFNGSSVTIGNFYGPNNDNTRAIEDFLSKIDEYENPTVIIGGDFNFCLNITKDRESKAKRVANNDKCRQVLEKYMIDKDLVDLWRVLHPQKRDYTCLRTNPPSKSRIDMFLTSKNVLYTKGNPTADIKNSYLTDHKMISISVNVPSIEMGRSYWKFNNDLLKDETFTTMVRQKIPEIVTENRSSTLSSVVLFETLLCVLRGYIIQYASRKKRESFETLESLEEEIQVLQDNESADVREVEALLRKRDTLIQEMTSKRMFRSKARWRSSAETGSRYFHQLGKRNSVKNIVKALFVRDRQQGGQEVMTSDTNDMLEEGRMFFNDMYKKRPLTGELHSFVEGLASLSEEDAEYCNGPINMEELTITVFAIRNNSSPGPSGYTGEFYKFFWTELKLMVHNVCCEIFEQGKMPVSIKRSVTILIPKRGKDSRKITNLRPISLLNTLYKLITKCLANRLARIVKKVINADQTGFIKGRYIGENIRLLLDLKDYCYSHKISALLLACDVAKAYDCVDWQYLRQVIDKIGLGGNFLRWVDVLYDTDPNFPATASVQINGKLSREYTIQRGLRQGCPLSCILFLMAFEPLLERIRKSDEVQGINIDQTAVKLTSYCDDVTVILDGSEESMSECLRIFDQFKGISGLELNLEKTQAFWVGYGAPLKPPICPSLNIQWPRGHLEVLGVKIPNDPKTNIAKLNYETKFESIVARFTPWNGRGLTPYGRIHLIKSEIISQLVYLMSVLPNPAQDFIKKVEAASFKFVWGGKRDRIKRATLKAKYKEGGLQFPDLLTQSQSLKIAWIKKYLDEENQGKWKVIMHDKLSINRTTTIFHCNSKAETLQAKLGSQFWEQTCLAWYDIKQSEKMSGETILAQVIWDNKNIGIERNQSINKRRLIGRGLVRISDIYDSGRKQLLTSNEAALKFNIHPLIAHSIVRSIPFEWKQCIATEKPCVSTDSEFFTSLNDKQKTAKWAYWILRATAPPLPAEKCHEKWLLDLRPVVSPQMSWSSVYDRLHQSTTDVNLKWLQYRMVKRILPTNRLLYIFGLSETDKCKKCLIYSENIMHKFWLCPSVRMLWHAVKELLGLQHNLTSANVIFGIHLTDANKAARANTVIMLTNQMIWKHRDCHGNLTTANLKRHITDYLATEHYIAKIDHKERKFNDMWGSLRESLDPA